MFTQGGMRRKEAGKQANSRNAIISGRRSVRKSISRRDPFDKAIPAALVRRFGFALLEKGAEQVNLKSFKYYDRMLLKYC